MPHRMNFICSGVENGDWRKLSAEYLHSDHENVQFFLNIVPFIFFLCVMMDEKMWKGTNGCHEIYSKQVINILIQTLKLDSTTVLNAFTHSIPMLMLFYVSLSRITRKLAMMMVAKKTTENWPQTFFCSSRWAFFATMRIFFGLKNVRTWRQFELVTHLNFRDW